MNNVSGNVDVVLGEFGQCKYNGSTGRWNFLNLNAASVCLTVAMLRDIIVLV